MELRPSPSKTATGFGTYGQVCIACAHTRALQQRATSSLKPLASAQGLSPRPHSALQLLASASPLAQRLFATQLVLWPSACLLLLLLVFELLNEPVLTLGCVLVLGVVLGDLDLRDLEKRVGGMNGMKGVTGGRVEGWKS